MTTMGSWLRGGSPAGNNTSGSDGYEGRISYNAPRTLMCSQSYSFSDNDDDDGLFRKIVVMTNKDKQQSAPPASLSSVPASPVPAAGNTSATTSTSNTDSGGGGDDECPICLDDLSGETQHSCVVRIRSCRHVFHGACLQDILGRDDTAPKCPVCRAEVACEPRGTSPSGTMTITVAQYGPGFLEIDYNLPSGVQSSFHPNPRRPFEGTHRYAYLPDTHEGHLLLKRFVWAFQHGMMFTIGTSMTTGRSDVVVWSTSVPQKSSRYGGGPFGFPDPNYVSQINAALDQLHVPQATDQSLSGGPADDLQQNRNNGVDVTYTAPATLSKTPLPGVVETIRSPSGVAVAPSAVLPTNNDPSSSVVGSLTSTARSFASSFASASQQQQQSHQTTDDVAVLDSGEDESCAICLDLVSKEPSVEIRACKHAFHESCIRESLNHEAKCPVCRTQVGEPQGRSPSGTMTIKRHHDVLCPGFHPPCKAFEITYNMPCMYLLFLELNF